jgi:hypothetical protein
VLVLVGMVDLVDTTPQTLMVTAAVAVAVDKFLTLADLP